MNRCRAVVILRYTHVNDYICAPIQFRIGLKGYYEALIDCMDSLVYFINKTFLIQIHPWRTCLGVCQVRIMSLFHCGKCYIPRLTLFLLPLKPYPSNSDANGYILDRVK